MDLSLTQSAPWRFPKEFTRMNCGLLVFQLQGGTAMQRTPTHFEQVPLETIQAIIRAEKKRRSEPEAAPPSSKQQDPKPGIQGRDWK
jgi:hypothetical protein